MQPRRFSIAYKDWPEREQSLWVDRIVPATRYISADHGYFLSERTLRAAKAGFELWIGFLIRTGRYSTFLGIREHASAENVSAFISDLLKRRRPISVRSELRRLVLCHRLAYGQLTTAWSKPFLRQLNDLVRATPQPQRYLKDSSCLFNLGLSLLQRKNDAGNLDQKQTIDYRDGLMIAVLASRPIRSANLSQMILGEHLVAIAGVYWIVFRSHETKTNLPIHVPLPNVLTPYIAYYVTHIRPRLAGQRHRHRRVWCTTKGTPMSPAAIYMRIAKRTKEEFGTSIPPHRFRHAAATSLAIVDPGRVTDAHRLLGHTSYQATEQSYNLSAPNDGAQKLQAYLAKRRKSLADQTTAQYPEGPILRDPKPVHPHLNAGPVLGKSRKLT